MRKISGFDPIYPCSAVLINVYLADFMMSRTIFTINNSNTIPDPPKNTLARGNPEAPSVVEELISDVAKPATSVTITINPTRKSIVMSIFLL